MCFLAPAPRSSHCAAAEVEEHLSGGGEYAVLVRSLPNFAQISYCTLEPRCRCRGWCLWCSCRKQMVWQGSCRGHCFVISDLLPSLRLVQRYWGSAGSRTGSQTHAVVCFWMTKCRQLCQGLSSFAVPQISFTLITLITIFDWKDRAAFKLFIPNRSHLWFWYRTTRSSILYPHVTSLVLLVPSPAATEQHGQQPRGQQYQRRHGCAHEGVFSLLLPPQSSANLKPQSTNTLFPLVLRRASYSVNQ